MKLLIFVLCVLHLLVGSMGGHTHFIDISIINRSTRNLTILSPSLSSGKWFDCFNGTILDSPKKVIQPDTVGRVCALAIKGKLTGANGTFQVYMKGYPYAWSERDMCQVNFSVPYGNGDNSFFVRPNPSFLLRSCRSRVLTGDEVWNDSSSEFLDVTCSEREWDRLSDEAEEEEESDDSSNESEDDD